MKTLEQDNVLSAEDRVLLAETKKIIQGLLPTAEVLLYGSVARGTQGPDSDYDVLVLAERELSTREKDRVRCAIYDMMVTKDTLISTFFFAKDFWAKHPYLPFRQEVEKDAVVL